MKVMERTENGTTTYVTMTEGLTEISHAQMDGKRDVRTMSGGGRGWFIEYKDGRQVHFARVDVDDSVMEAKPEPAKPAEAEGIKLWTGQIVTVKGKRYVASTVNAAREARGPMGAREAYVHYWSERNGNPFGATRFGRASSKPGTVARAIWDAVNQ